MDWSAHAKKPIDGTPLDRRMFRIEGGKLNATAEAQLKVALVLADGLIQSGTVGAGPFNVTVAGHGGAGKGWHPHALTVSVTNAYMETG